MRLFPFFIRHFLPIGLVSVLGVVLFTSVAPADSTRVDGFGIDMDALPALTLDNMDAILTMVQSTGAEYIVQEFDWSEIETSADVYNWSAVAPLDLLVSSANTRGLRVVAVLTGGPVYLAVSGQPVNTEVFGERWEKFVQATVDHFGESVDIWQIGSDVNSNYGMAPFLTPLSPDAGYAPNTEFYSNVLQSASKIIKTTDPNDQVWMGSLTGMASGNCAMNPLTFMLEMNATKAWKRADVIPYQPSQGAAVPENQAAGLNSSACSSNLMTSPGSMTAEIQAVQELARQLGGKQVIVTGLKWNDSDLQSLLAGRQISSDQLEADLLVRASAALMAQNSIATIIWNTDISSNSSTRNALTNFQQILKDSKPLGQVQGSTGTVFEYRFRQGGKITAIAWRSQDGDTAYPVVLQAQDIASFTAFAADADTLSTGTGLAIPANDANEAVVMLNERPVIFTGKSGDLIQSMKLAVTDQVELWKIELKNGAVHWFNNQKASLNDLLDQWLDQAKESAIEWGEDKLDELLP